MAACMLLFFEVGIVLEITYILCAKKTEDFKALIEISAFYTL